MTRKIDFVWMTTSGIAAAALAASVFVTDPLGFGIGQALAAQSPWNEVPPPTGANAGSRFYEEGFRTDVVDIPIPANDGDLEYKIKMKAGDTVVYSWEVRQQLPSPDFFYTEFHGHTEPPQRQAGQPPPAILGDVTFYRKATGLKDSGAMIAPFPGIHGWYMQNQSEIPIVVRLRIAGFYELVPGQAGTPVRE
jgi:hypothetical protein